MRAIKVGKVPIEEQEIIITIKLPNLHQFSPGTGTKIPAQINQDAVLRLINESSDHMTMTVTRHNEKKECPYGHGKEGKDSFHKNGWS